MYCTHCGSKVEGEDVQFCTQCGKSVTKGHSAERTAKAIGTSFLSTFITKENLPHIVVIVLGIAGILFIRSLEPMNYSTVSIKKLKAMPCEKFLSLSQQERLEIGNRFYKEQSGEINSFAGASMMMSLEYGCNTSKKQNPVIGEFGN